MYIQAAILSLLPLLSNAAPQPRSLHKRVDISSSLATPRYDHTKDTYPLYMASSCSTIQQTKIKQAIAEAGYLADALALWEPQGAFQNSYTLYIGADSGTSFKNQIQGNVNRAWKFKQNQGVTAGTAIIVQCNEDTQKEKVCAENPDTPAYTITSDWGSLVHNVFLCPLFFSDDTHSLAADLASIRANTNTAKSINNVYGNGAFVWLHEMFHWTPTISFPHVQDTNPWSGSNVPIYGPWNIVATAKALGSHVNAYLADAYAFTAAANFVMRTFGLDTPPTPGVGSVLYTWRANDSPPQGYVAPGNTTGIVTALQGYTKFSAADAAINANDYLPQPQTFPTCNAGDSKCNYISSCGEDWIPVLDFTSNGVSYTGYQSAVNAFCANASGAVLAPKDYYKVAVPVGFDQGKNPSGNGKPGYLNFEIHNKFTDTHYVSQQNCVNALMAMATPGQGCYGPNNQDTKGGTFQIGKDKISYHALGSNKKHDEVILGLAYIDNSPQVDPDTGSNDNGDPFGDTNPPN